MQDAVSKSPGVESIPEERAGPPPIGESVSSYEAFLREALGGAVVEADLEAKHRKMRKSARLFLRATCWRWAETVHTACGEAADAPAVLSVGDAHFENFGLWRDAEGRLVWGVNDFDEAAETPYTYDLIRLAASAIVMHGKTIHGPGAIAEAVLDGYAAGLAAPRPFVLESEHHWLRKLFSSSKPARVEFWDTLTQSPEVEAPAAYAEAIKAALPHPGLALKVSARQAGAGSLGRPRYVGLAHWHNAPVAREAKALIPSCWHRAGGGPPVGTDLMRAARGPYRSGDPFYAAAGSILVRRLAPDSRKLEAVDIGDLGRRLLRAMGFEIANIHAADHGAALRISADLSVRGQKWLKQAAVAAARATLRDWKDYRRKA